MYNSYPVIQRKNLIQAQKYSQSDKHLRYRSQVDIIGTILEAIASSGGATKSEMFYASFLSYHRLRKYMVLLIKNELLTEVQVENKRVYKSTDKGMHFLRTYNAIRELLDYC